VADLLGYEGPFVELRQACTGFANALVFATGLLSSRHCGPVAVVGSETGSIYFDPLHAQRDPAQLVNALQMGDAAGACVLVSPDRQGVAQLGRVFFGYAGARLQPGFRLEGGGSDIAPTPGMPLEFAHDYVGIRARGAELFAAALSAARDAGIDTRGVDHFIPHQANGKMASLLATSLGLDEKRVFVNANRIGNTGSAAIWVALHELRARLSVGEQVCVLGAEATKYLFGGFLYVHG
jgi:3-oxoacyl-[acyl-carrier-protein] synthase-3